MSTLAIEQRLTELWERPKTVRGWFATVDHKDLGIRYVVTAFVFLLVGGLEALLMRIQLSGPEQTVLGPESYDQVFSMHGITMIFWYAAPILSGFAVFLVPLMIGARDMAFPRLNAFTYWAYLLSGILLYIAPAMGQAPHGGWFAYMPYTGIQFSPSYGLDFYALSLIFLTVSTTGGAVNFIVTILRLRAPGMTISRMPLFLYSTLTISFAILLALPCAYGCLCLYGTRPALGYSLLSDSQWWRSHSLATALLVFWPPLGICDFPSRHGDDFHDRAGLLAASDRWPSLYCDLHHSHGSGWLRRLAASHVHDRHV